MKITKYFLSMAAAVGMIAGCQKTEIVKISAPEDVIAPVLEDVQGPIEITSKNMATDTVVFTWTPADFGVATQINYSLVASAAGNAAEMAAGLTDTTIVVKYETLNQFLFNTLELPSGVAEDVVFKVGAKVGEYETVYSNAITVSCKVTEAEKVYPKLTVAGSYAYNNWSPGKGQYVYDFAGTDTQYSGVIDFGEDVSALQFKFVGESWGNNEFSVPAGEAQAAEAAELPLVAGGGDNISAYTTHRFYSLTLDKAAPKVIKNFSFNQIGVIGSFNGWAGDVVMQFNTEKQKFYADVEFTEAGQFKLRADADWALNWGADAFGMTVSNGDGNLEAEAGKYRIYANMNNPEDMIIELIPGMYGKDEPVGGTTTPEPEPEVPAVQGWGLVGEFNKWGEEPDAMLASDGTYLVAKSVALSGQVKFRKDGDWVVNFGAPGDVEPVEVTLNTELELVASGKNFTIAEGTYDVYLDEANAKAWFITDGSYPGGGAAPEASEWGIVGVVNNWGFPDVTMYKTSTEGLFVAYNLAMPNGGFKIRKSATGEWNDDANYGLASAGDVEVDHAYDLICSGGSGDMRLVAGNYDIWFDLTNSKVYIMTPGKPISEAVGGEVVTPEPEANIWYLVGAFNSWTVADIAYQMTFENGWHVLKNFTLAEDSEVKLNAGTWDVNRGGVFTAVDTAISVEHNGANLSVPAGSYDVYLNEAEDTLYFMTPGATPAN